MAVYPSPKLHRILQIIVLSLIAVILIGTVAGMRQNAAKKQAAHRQETDSETKEEALYGDIGQLRVSTVDIPPATIILTPFLEYRSEDTAFQEELVNKKEVLKHSIIEWFSIQSAYRLNSEPPETMKRELITAINAQLVLGKIQNIYFEDFVILY